MLRDFSLGHPKSMAMYRILKQVQVSQLKGPGIFLADATKAPARVFAANFGGIWI